MNLKDWQHIHPSTTSQQPKSFNLALFMLYVLLVALFLLPNHNVSYLIMLGATFTILLHSMIQVGALAYAILVLWSYVFCSTIAQGVYDLDVVLIVKLVFMSMLVASTMVLDRSLLFCRITETHFKQMQYFILLLALVLVFSQFVLIYKISPLNDLILSIYMTGDVFASMYEGEIRVGTERSGGLFINPNQIAKAFSFLLVMAAIVLSMGKANKPYVFYATFVVISIGVFVSGSRTGLLVIAFIFFLWNVKYITPAKIALFFIGVIAVIALQTMLASSRVFSSDASALGSLFYKLDFTALYLSKSQFLEMILGHGLNSYHSAIEGLSVGGLNFGFDADIGYAIFHFGVLGTAAIVICFILLKIKFDIPGYVYGVMLWIITSSIFFNIRGIALMTVIFILLNLKITWEKSNNAE